MEFDTIGKRAGDDVVLDAKMHQDVEEIVDDIMAEMMAGFPAVQKSSPAEKSVLFIGLKIQNAEPLAIEGGEDHEDFHVTLAYGRFDTDGRDEDDISRRVQNAVDHVKVGVPDTIKFDAMGRFQASESSDGKDVIYAQVASGQLEEAHDALLDALKKQGIKLEETFPEYKPHMTLAYIDPGEEFELKDLDASGTTTEVMIGYGQESSHEHNFTILKADDDKRLVFGWASISITVDGEQLEDRQKDMIDPEDLEEAAYEYVLNFRDTGEEHISSMRKKGKLVESCVFTAEKQKAIGIPEGTLPIGWWIGFKIEDDAAWEKVKNGTYRMFSIEGKANRVPVEKSVETVERVAKTFDEILKFNPYHDSRGRFSNANGYAQFTIRTRDPKKQYMADMAIAREKERAAAANQNPTNDPATIAGVKRGSPMTHQQADEGRGNPHYEESREYRINCQSCVVAYEARLRGYDVEAVARTKKIPEQENLARKCESAWIDPATGEAPKVLTNDPKIRTAKQAQKWLEQNVEPGGRYEFSHGWKGTNGRNGHIVTVSRDSSGSLRIFDPQSGKTYAGDGFTEYMSGIKSTYSVEQYNPRRASGWERIPHGRLQLLRVDNMQINPDVANVVLKGAN